VEQMLGSMEEGLVSEVSKNLRRSLNKRSDLFGTGLERMSSNPLSPNYL